MDPVAYERFRAWQFSSFNLEPMSNAFSQISISLDCTAEEVSKFHSIFGVKEEEVVESVEIEI